MRLDKTVSGGKQSEARATGEDGAEERGQHQRSGASIRGAGPAETEGGQGKASTWVCCDVIGQDRMGHEELRLSVSRLELGRFLPLGIAGLAVVVVAACHPTGQQTQKRTARSHSTQPGRQVAERPRGVGAAHMRPTRSTRSSHASPASAANSSAGLSQSRPQNTVCEQSPSGKTVARVGG